MDDALDPDVTSVRKFTKYDDSLIQRIINNESKHKFKRRVCISINDIGGEGLKTAAVAGDTFCKLVTISRHYNFTLIVEVQNMVMAPTIMRNNCDGFITFAVENPYEMKLIANTFGFTTPKFFTQFMDEIITEPYDFIFNNRSKAMLSWWKGMNHNIDDRKDYYKQLVWNAKRKREDNETPQSKRQRLNSANNGDPK